MHSSSIQHEYVHGDLQLFLICTFIIRALRVRNNCYSGPPTISLPGRAHILLLSPYGLWSRINCRSESKCQGCSPMLMANRRIRTIWRAQKPQFFCHTPGEKWRLWFMDNRAPDPTSALQNVHETSQGERTLENDIIWDGFWGLNLDYLISQVSIQPNPHIFFTSSCKRAFIYWILSQLFSLMPFVSLCSLLSSRRPFQILL